MSSNKKSISEANSRKSAARKPGIPSKVRQSEQNSDASVLSPLALMALGLTGGASAAALTESPTALPAAGEGNAPVTLESPISADVVVDLPGATAGAELQQQFDTLVRSLLAEQAGGSTTLAAIDLSGTALEAAADAAPMAEPVLLAQATVAETVAAPAAATSTVEAAAATTAVTAGAGGISMAAVAAGVAGVVLASVASSKSSSDNSPPPPADTTAPAAPNLALATNSGSTADSITNVGTVNVAGLEAGATWQYSTNGGTSWTTGSGSNITLSGDGAKSVIVRQTDAAGNVSASSATLSFTLDTAVSAPTPTLAIDSGTAGDGITNVGTVNVAGLESGATWQYSSNGGSTWTSGSGSSFTLTGDGAKSVTVRQTDAAGNVSAASSVLAFTLDTTVPTPPPPTDTTAPAAPVIALATNSGLATDSITNAGSVNVSGLESGATWQYSTNSGVSWTSGSGSSFTLSGDGAKTVTVRQTDAAGNVSATSSALAFTLDSTAAAPTASLATNSGLATDSITNAGSVNVTGVESGASWQYSTDGGSTWLAGTGSSLALTGDGAKSVSVRQTDVAGNVSAASSALAFTLDGTVAAPAASLTTNSGLATDSITNIGSVNVTGLESGASWQYSTDGGNTWTAGSGSSFTLTGDGAKSVTVRQTDVAGNVSAASSALSFTLDGTAAAPTLSLAVDSGALGDGITNNGTVNVTGLETGASWQYSTNGGTNWTTGTGSSFTLTGDGAKSVTVRQTDVAGNISTSSGALAFTLDTVVPPPPDTTPPSAPTITLATDSGIAADSITNVGTVNVAGLEAGASWQYSTNAGVSWTSGSGSSFTLAGDGAKSVIVHQTDAAGNVSAASSALAFTLDSAAPNVVSLAAHSDSQTIELTYDSALDTTVLNRPAPGDFSVSTTLAGVTSTNAVASIAVAGTVMTLTLTNAFAAGAVSLSYTDPSALNDAAAVQDLAGNDAVSFASGVVADGYVRGASVYIDTNHNGTVEVGTDYLVGTTDANGNFFIPTGAPSGSIIAVGGVNIDTGVPNTMPLKAPEGSTTINPLTTLVEAVVQASHGSTSAAAAAAAVASNLGLNLGGQSLLDYDPYAAGNLTAQKAAAQVATIITLAENAVTGAGSTVVANLVTELNNASSSGSTLNLADSSTVDSMLGNSLAGASAQVLSAIADASSAISSASDLAGIATAQSQALDTIAAQAPTLTVAASTNDTTPSVRISFNTSATDGTAAIAGDTLLLKDGGVQIGTAVVLDATDIAAGFKLVDASTLTEGSHNLSATLTDQAGNTSAASGSATVTIDTQAPSAPSLNVVASDDLIGGSEQTTAITGNAEANASVTLTVGTGNTHVVTASNSGTWSYNLTAADITAMGQGSETLSATATDAAGNISSAGTRAINVDTVAPTATVAVTGADDNVTPTTGNIVAGSTTNDNTLGLSGTVTGSLGSGEVVAVYDGASRLGLATVSGANWTFNTSSLGNASHSFSARVEDAAGNTGSSSSAYAITVNAVVPTATASITAVTDDVALVTGNVANAGLTNDNAPVLSGTITGTLGADSVVIYDGANVLGTASVTGSNWSYAPATLSAGSHSFSAVVEASGGNQGVASSAFSITVDTTAPVAPTINPVAVDNTVNIAEQTATVSGTAEAGATVSLTLGSGNVQTVTANGQGNWSYTLQAADITAMGQGAETLSASATDVAGNLGTAATRDISVDTAAPTTTITTVAGDNAINASELATGVSVSGISEAGAQIALTLGSGNIHNVTANGSGAWTYTLSSADIKAMGQGAETLSATATDAAGNTGAATTRNITIDSVAPTLTSFALATASDSGTAGDGKSNIATPSIEFTAEIGATLAIDQGAGYAAAGTGTGTETGSAQTLVLPNAFASDGTYTISLRATDVAGNTTVRSGSYVYDHTAPPAPSITGVTDDVGTIKGLVASAGRSDDTVLVINGTAEAYASVSIFDNTTQLGTAVSADKTGAWSFTTPTLISGTSYVFNAKATDASGNTGSASANHTVTIDTLAPTAAIVLADSALKAGETSLVTITFSEAVTGFDNTDLTLANGTLSAVSSADSGVTWTATFTPTADVTDTTNVVTLANTGVADLAGNAGVGTTDSANYTIDTLRPTATVVLADTALKAGETSGVTITFNEAVTGFDNTDLTLANGTLSAVSSADSGVTWTAIYTPTANVTDTSNLITLANTGVADLAGNAGLGSTDSANYTVDTLRPTATVVLADSALKAGETSGVTITFSEAVTGFDNTDLALANGTLSTVSSADSGVTWTATFTPTVDTTDTSNVITLDNTGVADLAGNAGLGSTDSANYSIDTSLPIIKPASPTDGGLSLGLASNLVLGANETVVQGTGTVSLYTAANVLVESINVTSSQVTISGTGSSCQISINPTVDLVKDQAYYIKVSAGALLDQAGNAWAGITDSTSWNFIGAGATVLIGTVAGSDNTVNLAESGATITINGTLGAEATVLAAYTWADMTAVLHPATGADVTLGNFAYSYSSGATGNWSADIAAAALSGTNDYTLTVSFVGKRGAALDIIGVGTKSVHVDTVVAAPTVALTSDSSDGVTGHNTDNISNVGTLAVTGTETSAVLSYSLDSTNGTNGTWTSSFSAADGANTVYVRQTDIAGNVSTGTALSFTYDHTAAAPVVSLSSDSGTSNTDKITSSAALTLGTAAESVTHSYVVDSGAASATYTAPTVDGAHTVVVTDTDVAGNTASTTLSFTLDTAGPSVTMGTPTFNSTTGVVTFGYSFNEAVTGFGVDDVTVVNGAKGTFTTTDASHYSLVITPDSSLTPISGTVDVAAGAATDTAGNASTAAAQFIASVLYGTSGNNTLTVGSAMDNIFLGGGSDTIKFATAAGSTTAATDRVMDVFGTGDKIDLSTLLGTGGSGYTSSALGDSGAGFVELKDVTLTPSGGNTVIQFNIHFDAATIDASKITGAVIDLAYTYSAVSNSQIVLPTFSYSDGFGGSTTANIWSQIQSNLFGVSSNGKIAVIADSNSANTIIDGSSNAMLVRLLVSGSVSTFGIGLESRASGGDTYITTADGLTHNVDVGISKTAGVTIGSTGTLEIITDTSTLGTVGDNQLHMVSTFSGHTTHLEVRYDTNATFGATTLSNIIALDFEGDVRASLTPANLTYI